MSTTSQRAQELTDRLVRELNARGFTAQQLADEAELSYATSHKLMNGKMRQIPLDTAVKVAHVLGWSFRITQANT
jgi:DNA-binding Xre family transcriptional regulator